MPKLRIKDQWSERRQFVGRVWATAFIVLLLLSAVIGRLLYLQVINYRHYATLSEGNRVRIEPVRPTRGLIYDRNGVLLADNVPTYQLEVTLEQVPDLQKTLAALGKIVALRPQDLAIFRDRMRDKRPFQAVALRTNLSDEEVARFAVNRQKFPGVDIRARLTRTYPLGAETAHVVGYVGNASAADLRRLDPSQYSGSSEVGKSGVERAYEGLLHGSMGNQQVEVNAQGRVLRVLDYNPPVAGGDLYLSLDIRLQEAAGAALGSHQGAVVAIDPNTGEVLAMVSKPSFDPNLFVDGIDAKTYAALRDNPKRPLFNRDLRGQYPPGSTIKPFMGLAGLYYHAITPHTDVMCPGYFKLQGESRPYRDWKRTGHGHTDLRKAITQSCDVYFYTLAVNLGIDRIHDFLSRFGFGSKSDIDLPSELGGLLPSREWKRKTRSQPWFPGETVITGIGQGYMLVTPLQLASATATMAARGERFRPRVLHAVRNPLTGMVINADSQPDPPVDAPADEFHQIVSDMLNVTKSPWGTAHRISYGAKYTIAGKTGTAQVYSLSTNDEEADESQVPEALRDHALFISFAPVEAPRIALAVIVEHGGGGGSVAAPIARAVMDAYFSEVLPR